jgi:hypothetical protein
MDAAGHYAPLCRAARAVWGASLTIGLLAAKEPILELSGWAGLNPDLVSTGRLWRLPAAPARAAAGFSNPTKGKPPAILDARVGVNVRLGEDPGPLPADQRGQAEPHLIRSALRPDLLLATFQEGRYSAGGGAIGCGYSISRDGGSTWSRGLIPHLTAASGGPYLRATDPVAAAGPQGDLYLNALGSIDDGFGLAAVVVSRSADEGATWSDPVVVYRSPSGQVAPDKNWLSTNEFPGSPTLGRLICTWTSFTRNAAGVATGNNLVASLSDDRGSTWSAPIEITPAGSSNQGTQPVFLADGSLAVVYATFLNPNNAAQFRIDCKVSRDGGRTYPSAPSTVVPIVAGWDDPEMREGVFLPSATVARQSGEMFVTYTAVIGGTPRIMLTRSNDRGATWSAPVSASDQPEGISVMNPAVATSPDGNVVSVVFMDKRHAPGGRGAIDLYSAQSFDHGATWRKNLRLSTQSSDLRYAPLTASGVMLGDYLAVAPAYGGGQPWVAIWCDTRNGDADPYTVRFSPAAEADFGAWANARGLAASTSPSDLFADSDTDGDPNYLEFIAGTEPGAAKAGESLFVSTSSPTATDVFWTERSDASRLGYIHGVSSTSVANLGSANPFGSSAGVLGNVPADQYPTVAPANGLVWRGARFTGAPGGTAFVRSVKYSAVQPAATSGVITVAQTDARLTNLSTRGQGGNPLAPLILGFVLDGRKSVLVRAGGPALTSFGVSGALPDPVLTLTSATPGAPLVAINDHWSQGNATPALFARVGAFPFATGSRDAALVESLGAGAYTAIATAAAGNPGVTLVEIYDADLPPAPARLVNLSARGGAGLGDNALMAGFVISGLQPRRVLVRAVGPSLSAFGVGGALADPVLTLFRGERALATNDDWEISRSPAVVAATAQRVGAFALPPGSLDAALLITLSPGPYTAVITSADGSTGVALIEVYDAD